MNNITIGIVLGFVKFYILHLHFWAFVNVNLLIGYLNLIIVIDERCGYILKIISNNKKLLASFDIEFA